MPSMPPRARRLSGPRATGSGGVRDPVTRPVPGVLPGSAGAWVFEARPYRRNAFIGQQNIDRNQTRDSDRRIARL